MDMCDDIDLVRELEIHNSFQSKIAKELEKSNKLREQELIQQYFFIELIEEVLPLDDGVKKHIHQRSHNFLRELYGE